MILTLLACGGMAGTWQLTITVDPATLPTSATTVDHNYLGAYEPVAAAEDPTWVTSSTEEASPALVFARIEETDTGATLIIGDSALPGIRASGGFSFSWTHQEVDGDIYQHITGYRYEATSDVSLITTIRLAESKGSISGSWEEITESTSTWLESDTWSEEVVTYVGTGGLTPVGSYLVKLDSASGYEIPASNAQASYDCVVSECSLSVKSDTTYSYLVAGIRTDFEPADANWTADAGQAAGI